MNNTDLVLSSLYVMPHFPGCNPNRHRRAFLCPCHPTPPRSLQKFQLPHVLISSLNLTFVRTPSFPLQLSLLAPQPSQRQQCQPCQARPWPDAAECLGEVPDVDTESISVVNTMASNLQLPTAILATTVSSAPRCMFPRDDTLSLSFITVLLAKDLDLSPVEWVRVQCEWQITH